MSYDSDAPTFAIFYTGTASGDEIQTVTVRAADAGDARVRFEMHAGSSAAVELVVPVVPTVTV